MTPFKFDKEKVLVDCFAVELYLPYDYTETGYRGTPFYSVLGTKVKFLGIGNFRFFQSEKEMEKPEKVPCHPFGIPMFIMSEPMDVETRDVKFSEGSPYRKCLVLSYTKGDVFILNTELIQNSDALMMTLSRLEQGKLDHVPPEVAVEILADCEHMNGVSLRIPPEETEIFVAERYRDPDHPERLYRYSTEQDDPYHIVSRNMRVDAHQGSTFQAIMHEDISSGLIASANRKRKGIVNQPGPFECAIRGISMEHLKEEDDTDGRADT